MKGRTEAFEKCLCQAVKKHLKKKPANRDSERKKT